MATALDKPGFVRVSVFDNGPGVEPDVLARLFTPFVTTKKFGMGVGLSLCKSIVENHRGEIGCNARKPHGAEFFFTLPICEAPRPADDQTHFPGPAAAPALAVGAGTNA